MNSRRFVGIGAALITVGGLVVGGCSSSSTATPTSAAAASAPAAAAPVVSQPAASAPAAAPASSAPVAAASSAPVAPASSAPASIAAAPSAAAATDLKIATTKLGPVIVDAKGMTVYYFKSDVPNSGKSVCSGKCLTAWPAVVPVGAKPVATGVTGKVGEITRSDGTKQLTVDGRPVYLFIGGKKAGATNGQDVKKVWFAVAPNGDEINS